MPIYLTILTCKFFKNMLPKLAEEIENLNKIFKYLGYLGRSRWLCLCILPSILGRNNINSARTFRK